MWVTVDKRATKTQKSLPPTSIFVSTLKSNFPALPRYPQLNPPYTHQDLQHCTHDNFLQILLHFSLLLRPLPAKVGFFHVLKDYFSRQIASATRQIRKLVKQKYESYVTASLQGTCTVSLYLLVSNILFLVFKIYLRYICIFSY